MADMNKGSEGKLAVFPQEKVILAEGEMNVDMYKIIKGHAEMYVGYGTPMESLIGIIGPQACFGEFGLLLHRPAIYTVIAYSEVIALRITEGDMGDFVQQNHKNIIEIMRNMANSMMTMRCQIDLLLKEVQSGRERTDEEVKEALREARRTMRQYALYQRATGSFDVRA